MVCFGAVIFDDHLDKTFYWNSRRFRITRGPQSKQFMGERRTYHQIQIFGFKIYTPPRI